MGISAKTLTDDYLYPPIDVVDIARRQGVEIRWIRGAAWRGACEGKVMYINVEEPPTRQRFMVAHLLCHILNHGGAEGKVFRCWCYKEPNQDFWAHLQESKPTRSLEVKSEEVTDFNEIQANIFALELLIPKYILMALSDNYRHPQTYYPAWLAQAFEVSEGLMRTRMAGDEFCFNPVVFEIEEGYIPPPKQVKPWWESLRRSLKSVFSPEGPSA